MRRVYYKNPKRKKITEEAMEQLRKTRAQIDPALLDRVRNVIEENQHKTAQAEQANSWADLLKKREMQSDSVPVDSKKMLQIAVKLLERQPQNQGLQKEISTFLESKE